MYEFIINDYTVAECIYTKNTIFPWTVQLYKCINEKWHPFEKMEIFKTLEEARRFCINLRGEKVGRLDK